MKILIRNARLITDEVFDILVVDGLIERIGLNLEVEADRVIEVPSNVYVSPGWIDMHTHAFKHFELYSDDPEEIGYKTGVTCVVDAGTTGADDMAQFYNDTRSNITRVYALVNIAHQGIKTQNELANLRDIQFDSIKKIIETYPDFILGLKARMSASVVGGQGIEPLLIGKSFANRLNLPLMVHVGSTPPDLDLIANTLDKGDIITHIFNGKENGMYSSDVILPSILSARNRGVFFDVGHGKESFSFNVAQKAFKDGFLSDTISSDIYSRNRLEGPVYSLVHTMNKLLYVGYSPEKIIKSVTEAPACIMNLSMLGKIRTGLFADLTFYKYDEVNLDLTDSVGKQVHLDKGFIPVGVLLKGEYYEIK